MTDNYGRTMYIDEDDLDRYFALSSDTADLEGVKIHVEVDENDDPTGWYYTDEMVHTTAEDVDVTVSVISVADG